MDVAVRRVALRTTASQEVGSTTQRVLHPDNETGVAVTVVAVTGVASGRSIATEVAVMSVAPTKKTAKEREEVIQQIEAMTHELSMLARQLPDLRNSLNALGHLRLLEVQITRMRKDTLLLARLDGKNWDQIAAAVGQTRQAVMAQFKRDQARRAKVARH